MLITEMRVQECEALLTRLNYGRLGCVRDNRPYIVPIYFAFEPGRLYGFATLGQKIDWMRLNPWVCVEVDEVLSFSEWTSVVVQGRYEEFPDTPDCARQRKQAQSMLQDKTSLWWQPGFAAAQTRQRFDSDITVFYAIHIETVSGRRASRDPKTVLA